MRYPPNTVPDCCTMVNFTCASVLEEAIKVQDILLLHKDGEVFTRNGMRKRRSNEDYFFKMGIPPPTLIWSAISEAPKVLVLEAVVWFKKVLISQKF